MNTEGPLFYYYMFICGSFGSKISGFQQAQRRDSTEAAAYLYEGQLVKNELRQQFSEFCCI